MSVLVREFKSAYHGQLEQSRGLPCSQLIAYIQAQVPGVL